ncbi:MAG: tetratricopeptide repeat protein [Acidobacteriota bacterium]
MRIARALFAVLLVCTAWSGLRAREPLFKGTPQEQAFVNLYFVQHKPIEAAQEARAYLAKHPDSHLAWMTLGWIRLQREGDLPRAYYDFSRSRELLEKHFQIWDAGSPWRAYGSTLQGFFLTAQHMERYREAVQAMDTFNRIFTPKRPAAAAWCLMKLGHINQARAGIAKALMGNNLDQKEDALNTLGAIQAENDQPEASYRTFKELCELEKKTNSGARATSLRNFAESAQQLLKFDESERLCLEATKYFNPGVERSPWEDLAELYIREHRLPEAIDAVKKMQAWAYHSLPVVGRDNWNSRRTMTACLLFYCGETKEALRLAKQVTFRPDRHGGDSNKAGQFTANSLLFYREVLLDHAARLREEMSWCKPMDWPGLYLRELRTRVEAWSSGRQAGRIIMAHPDWFRDTLRFIGPNTVVDFPGGEVHVVGVVGPGVAEAEILRLLKRTGAKAARERPFLTLLLGVARQERGRPRRAVKDLQEAMETLPKQLGVTRDQAVGYMARACREIGDASGEGRAIGYLMEHDPGCIRRFGLSLPAVISAGGGPAAQKAASLLKDSPRLSVGKTGYRVTVRQLPGGALEGSLAAPGGSVLCRLRVNSLRDPNETAREFCRAFHRKAFGPKLDLSQEQINSIEGSNLTSQDARQALKGLLGGGTNDESLAGP